MKYLPRKVISETWCQKMLPRNHQTSTAHGKMAFHPSHTGNNCSAMCLLPFPGATKLPCICGKQSPPTPARKTQPKPPQNYNQLPQLLGLMNGPLESQQKTSTPWAPRDWQSSPLQTAAKEISCSLSSLLAPFLHKANLVNSSIAPAQGHKLLWHQQLTQKCIWHSRHWITASQMAADWKGYKFSMCCLRNNLFAAAKEKAWPEQREKKDKSLQEWVLKQSSTLLTKNPLSGSSWIKSNYKPRTWASAKINLK